MRILVTGANGQLGNEMQVLAKENPQHTYYFTDVQELDICDRKFGFDDFQSCVEFYKSLINLFKQLNYSEWESDKFAEYRARIDEMVAAKESNK